MPEFTENQQKAITHSKHNILVSASAGSGKTTVLIERLIRKIVDDRIPVDRFLIVTFTRAAAGEMKERLEKALTAVLQSSQSQEERVYLQEQLALLPTAAVTTIDGFALQLIESYYYEIDLDPAFRLVADSAEEALFKNRVLDNLFNDLYEESHPNHQAFLNVLGNFASVSRDDGLKEIILKLANFDIARPEEDHWLASLADGEDLSQPLAKQRAYQDYLIGEVRPHVEESLSEAKHLLPLVEGQENKKLDDGALALTEVEHYLSQILSMIDNQRDYEELREAIALPNLKWPNRDNKAFESDDSDRIAVAEVLEKVASYRESYITGSKGHDSPLKKIRESFFRLSESQWQTVNARGQRVLADLVVVSRDYLAALKVAKAEANILYFSDLVVLARQILKNNDIKELVQNQFEEVMVDEYQDVNQLQEAFLKDMSNGHNMYMVGDIKQSIYGFRQAAPQLFAKKYADFASADNENERIELAENFRSHNNVTKMINQIFTQIMDQQLGDVPYQGSAKLIPKAAFPEAVPAVFRLDLLEIAKRNQEAANGQEDGASDDDRQTREKTLTYLLKKIQDLHLNGQIYDKDEPTGFRSVHYSDIAILTRSKTAYPELLRLAHDAGIPIQSESVGDYYQAMEIYLVLDLLRILDNPHQDIPLAAALRSPIFHFDEDKLAAIRLADEGHDFYTAFLAYAKENEKAAKVLDYFDNWRVFVRQNDLVGLIWAIYQDTGWLDYVVGLPGGAQRQANLHALYQRATTFQENGQSGLYAFIAYIEEVQDGGGNVGEIAQETSESAVSLMTIHKSKGLEFPIVILPDLDKDFNQRDSRSNFVLQKDAGAGLDYLEPTAKVKVPTLGKYAVKYAIKKQSWSEEMRLYYVALTRAKQQLYLIGRIDPIDGEKATAEQRLYENARTANGQFLPESQRLKAKSYLDWTLQALARTKNRTLDHVFAIDGTRQTDEPLFPIEMEEGELTINFVLNEDLPDQADFGMAVIDQAAADQSIGEQADAAPINQRLLEAKLSYRYPYEAATKTAAYQSVSEIKRLFEDPDRPLMADLYLDQEGRAVAKDDGEQKDLQADALDDGKASANPSEDDKVARMLTPDDLPMPDFMTDGKVKPSPTAVGTATHLLMQLVDFTSWVEEKDLQQMVADLVAAEKIAKEVAPLIDLGQLVDFLHGDFGQEIARHSQTLKREAPFAMVIPAEQVYEDVADDQPILVHGIIDGYFLDEGQKTVTVFDYKTDYVPKRPGTRQKEALKRMRRNYTGQLNLYRQALQQEYPDYKVLPGQLILLSAGLKLSLD
ncbi:helicase-exonuclease AddAB subunit AddA [Fructobacillus sp. M158]|uniref:helicase-exonuclease AddAB subunit AddA n=1 Tax=Fructobacillus parabroussonetiae TaxID=2713174 RepID=UPI00200A3EEB|nr:helicase-exonuclease AddAB subunit AddA [Fructobacillus parabroussonetiae]MCK8616818.1 helicase-exonuclease AddAB subunit AddA [Fructobacillus parabroussonetiae]